MVLYPSFIPSKKTRSTDEKMLLFNKPLPGKKAEEIRKTFNIKNDFTPEEEEQVIIGRVDSQYNHAVLSIL